MPGPSDRAARRILVADDDDACRRAIVEALKDQGFLVAEAQDGFELVKSIAPAIGGPEAPAPFDLIISSLRLPGWWAIDVVAKLSQHMLLPPFILTVRPGDEPLRRQARKLPGVALFERPFDAQALRVMVRAMILELEGS